MRNVIVTGGSRGLGLGIARKLTSEGFRAIAIARNKSCQLTSAMEQAEATNPGSFHFIPFDLTEIDGIADLIKRIRKSFGPIFGLVNNAGISYEGILATMRTSQIEQLVRLNTVSPMVVTKYVVRSMMAEGGGRIVNIASIMASTGFTRSLAREVGRLGITVNSVAPGFVETDMTHGLKDEQRQQIVRRSALQRLAEVDDVANAVEFLLSDRAKNITGTVLTVDAGSTA